EELQQNLHILSLVVIGAVLGLFLIFSRVFTRRVSLLLAGMHRVREGEYTHRVTLEGHDELTQLADQFNQLTGRLETTEAERRRFVSDASHELKTPLASIRLLTDSILQDENIDRETTREFVGDIGEAADRLIHISQELLELNRLDEGRMVRQEAVDVNDQVEKTCRLLSPLAEESQVTLKTRLGEDCVVRCSSDGVNQILRNLMENAIKYNVPGGLVRVITRREGDWVCLEVSDTGVGIPEADRNRIFERFYRVDKARSRDAGGTGLGLSIVRDTVRLYGGTISVAPNEPAGTTFMVLLPVWTEEEGTA
ncbi:MAG: HAMP domain-containing histidine kinase, partial [Ruminiclostridium sp.]|nr:HAMP domain-containing histidine kinase [Ruminiclostridium sp.]